VREQLLLGIQLNVIGGRTKAVQIARVIRIL
jgi:hypothetical protein